MCNDSPIKCLPYDNMCVINQIGIHLFWVIFICLFIVMLIDFWQWCGGKK